MNKVALFRTIVGVITVTALLVQYWIFSSGTGNGFIGSILFYFGFYTILSNWFAAAVLLVPTFAPHSGAGRFLNSPGVRTAAAVYLTQIAIAYYLLLHPVWKPQGLQNFLFFILHAVTPVAFAIDWFFLTPKQDLKVRMALRWLAFPAAFCAWTLAYGAFSGDYPYPFFRVDALGYPAVLTNMLILLSTTTLNAVGMIVLGRRMPPPKYA